MANFAVELRHLLSKLLLVMLGRHVHVLQSKGCRNLCWSQRAVRSAYGHHSKFLLVRGGHPVAINEVCLGG